MRIEHGVLLGFVLGLGAYWPYTKAMSGTAGGFPV